MQGNSPSENPEAQLQSLMAAGDLGRANQLAMAILQQDAGNAEANMAIARIRLMQGLWTEAEQAASKVLEINPGSEELRLMMASIHGARGQTAEALEWCDQVLADDSAGGRAWLKKAELLERSGDISASMEALDQSGIADPASVFLRARCLIRNKDHAGAVEAINSLLSNQWSPVSPGHQARLLGLRAKANDALQRYDDAFADAVSSKKLTPIPFDQASYIAEIDQIIETFTADRLKPVEGHEASDHQHLFIAGMPRSGTTLFEQILDAHPGAVGVGEAKEIHVYSTRLQNMLGSWVPWPSCAGSMTGDQRRELAQGYEKSLLDYGFAEGGLFVNKNLQNLRLLGFIAMLFPGSRVIFTHRDPRDTGLSCFLGNFSSRVHPELQTISDIAMVIEQHERLMNHWKSVLPLQWIDMTYEDIVHEPEENSRSMIEFAGLPWDDRCLSFFSSGRTVMTLSYDQVNRPMYSSSIGRYKNYESHLGPLLKS